MLLIDTHCHVSLDWYEPVENLVAQMDRNGVAHAVLVQMRGQYDNRYQFECEKAYPGRFVSVVLVDTNRPDAPEQLEQLAAQGARGVRLAPSERSPGDDPLAIWRKAAELRLPVSCGGNSAQCATDEFAALIAVFPHLPIIIEHLGGLTAWGDDALSAQGQRILALARFPNVYMKIPGLGEFCRRNVPVTTAFPFDRAGLSILREVYAAFGPERLMWGSDYPPVSGREGYANALRFPLAEFALVTGQERALIFGGVAAKVYGLAGADGRVTG